jgi:hypothetical protein
MSSTIITRPASAGGAVNFSRISMGFVWTAVLAIGAYFVVARVPTYFVWSEETYGAYYWPRAGFLLPHIIAGLIAIVIGPFQFWRHSKWISEGSQD